MAEPPVPGALALARACRASSDYPAGLLAAEAAWVAAADDGQRAQAAVERVFFTFRLGQLPALLQQAPAWMPLVRAHGGDQAFETLRILALAACELGRIDQALPYAMEAHTLAEADGRPAPRAQSLMALGACFERMGDPWQAERLMRDALALAPADGPPRDRFVALNNLSAALIGAFYLLRGSGTQAEANAALARALPLAREMQTLLPLLTEPYLNVHAQGNLGEVLLHLGHAEEARSLLAAARAIAEQVPLTSQVQRVRCSMAEWALLHRQPEPARDDMLALLQEEVLMPLTRLRAHHAVYDAARQLGDAALALHHLERRTELERQRAVQQLRAQSEQFITRVEAEQSRRDADRERRRAQEMAQHALRDPLTGLGNRRELSQQLPPLLAEAQRTQRPLALVMLDLDHFKRVNDQHGHLVGDAVLVAVAQLLRQQLRNTDLLARTGGEEFLAVLPGASPARALEVCERIRAQVQAHDWSGLAPGLQVTLSAGLASAPPCEESVLMARADAALYRAKAAGRNRIELG
ncbi:MAG: GGDEF domain-containing protein [Rubrivivax sp.]|nr:GGDEF domain-containing protein [Rubrivivax sp.]